MYFYSNKEQSIILQKFINIRFEEPIIPPEPKSSFGWEDFKESLEFLKTNKGNEKYITIDTI